MGKDDNNVWGRVKREGTKKWGGREKKDGKSWRKR
jgi:hypothetical protein